MAAEPLSRPDWSGIFSGDGKVIDLRGGVDAFFMEDRISDGIGVDASVIAPAGAQTVDNGAITAEHDLGNGYVWAKRDASANLQLYAGVERFRSTANGYVEFEFNQGVVQVHAGVPWPIHGERMAGDILVRADFVAGTLSSATFQRWNGSLFQVIATVVADGSECGGVNYLVCSGALPQDTVPAQVWDAALNPVVVPPPNTFLEVGLNVGPMEFTSVQVRTPQDVILDGFRQIGAWAR
jgi:hypothetical protein